MAEMRDIPRATLRDLYAELDSGELLPKMDMMNKSINENKTDSPRTNQLRMSSE